jgi:lipopolysaccharide export system ATP-binding protein
MSTQHSLKVTNISKSYSGRDVVSGVSFFVQSGEIVGLLGPNGAGKTTCFYIACGLVKTDSGQVILNNHKIDHLPMHKRAKLGLGYLPQEPSVFRKLSVADNIMAVLELFEVFLFISILPNALISLSDDLKFSKASW